MHTVGGLALLNLAFLLAGFGVLRAVGRSIAVWDAGLAFCVGVASLCVASSLLAVAGYVPGVAAFLALAVLAASPLALAPPGSMLPVRLGRPRLPSSLEELVVTMLGAIAAVYALATLAVASVKFLDEWDAWSMWTLKAKGLIVFGDLRIADFAGSAHPDYPILVPMLQSFVFRFVGRVDPQVVHVEHALLPIAFACAVARLLNGRLPASAVAAFGLVLVVVPGLARNVPDALADVPVAIFVSLSALMLGLWLTEKDFAWLALFVIFAAAATWTKDEGAASIGIMCIAAVPFALQRPLRRSVTPLAAAVAAVVVLFLPWHFWKAAHGATYDTNLAQGLSLNVLDTRRHAAASAMRAMWSEVGDLSLWLGVPYLLAAAVVASFIFRRGRRVGLFAILVPNLTFLAYVWVYAIRTDPLGLTWTLGTTVTRVTTSIGLMATTLLGLLLSTLGQGSVTAEEPPSVARPVGT